MSTRRINVLSAAEVHSGETNGKPWALYEIVATTEGGEPIDLKLKSFERLDGVVEVEVEKQEHEKYGTSYLLKRAGGGGGGGGGGAGARLGPKVDELRDRLDRLEPIVDRLREQVTGLASLAHQESREPAGAASHYGSPPPEPASEATFGDPDDIPF
jgi:hypothetical protein